MDISLRDTPFNPPRQLIKLCTVYLLKSLDSIIFSPDFSHYSLSSVPFQSRLHGAASGLGQVSFCLFLSMGYRGASSLPSIPIPQWSPQWSPDSGHQSHTLGFFWLDKQPSTLPAGGGTVEA